jgi:hypothetical protein
MKQFRRRRMNDDRRLKLMARVDQLKADQYRDEPLASGPLNAFESTTTESDSQYLTDRRSNLRMRGGQGWLDSSDVG